MRTLFLLLVPGLLFNLCAQELFVHHEVPDDPYIPVERSSMPRTAPQNVRTPNFFTTQVNVDPNGLNIVGDAANEPSIAVDPTNPNRIVIGWRQFDTTSSNFRQAGYGYSLDGGYNFTFPTVLEPGVFRSDPVLDVDRDGNFYYNSLQETFECDVWAIDDGGVVWSPPVPAFGGDKQWMHIDRSDGPGSGHNYSYWNTSFSTCPGEAFTRSTDGAESFEPCVSILQEPFWGTLTTDNNSDLYLVGRTFSDMVVLKSTSAKDPGGAVDWDFLSVVDLDGLVNGGGPINPNGLKGQAWIDVDRSDGPAEGTVYVLATVERTNGDPADVMFAKSQDGGVSWSPPIRVNIEPGNQSYQWFGTMSVAPNGRIDVVYLDSSEAPQGTLQSRLIYTWSDDQGDSWNDYAVLSDLFDPNIGYPNQNKMGDYFDMVSDNDYAHLAWCNTLSGGQDVYYSRISPQGILAAGPTGSPKPDLAVYPNPFREYVDLVFRSVGTSPVELSVYDLRGRLIRTLRNSEGNDTTGVRWDGRDHTGLAVPKGLYFAVMRTGDQSVSKKLLRR